RSIQARANHELSWVVTGAAHSFDRVDDQVENNLLQLDSIGQDERQVVRFVQELSPHHDTVSVQLALRQSDDFTDCLVDVEPVLARRRLLREGSYTADDLTGTVGVGDRERGGSSGLFQVLRREPAQAGAGIVHHGAERLIDLVRDGCRHLAERRDTRDVSQLRLGETQPVLRALPLDELADLAAESRHHVEKILIGWLYLAAQELDDSQDLAGQQYGKPEGSVQPLASGDGRAAEVRVVNDVGNAHGSTTGPDAPRQPDASAERAGERRGRELRDGHGFLVPYLDAAQDFLLSIDAPQRAEIPIQKLAHGPKDVWHSLLEGRSLGQRLGDDVLRQEPLVRLRQLRRAPRDQTLQAALRGLERLFGVPAHGHLVLQSQILPGELLEHAVDRLGQRVELGRPAARGHTASEIAPSDGPRRTADVVARQDSHASLDRGGEPARALALERVHHRSHIFGVDVCPQRRIVHAPDVPQRNGKQAEHQRAESHVHQRQAGRGEPKEADHVEFSIPSYSCASVRGFLHAAFEPVKAGTPRGLDKPALHGHTGVAMEDGSERLSWTCDAVRWS